MKGKILVVDDERRIRQILSRMLEDEGYLIETAGDGHEALLAVDRFAPDLVLLDLKMPRMGGQETLKALQDGGYPGKVVILTAFGSIPSAVQAMRSGAHDYVTKPFEADELLIVVERSLEQRRMELELSEARSRLNRMHSVAGIITSNPGMKNLLELVLRIAPTDAPVLIAGASGTGKELFARAVHQHSARKGKPFLALNCGALPENLIESELFGYKAGAFSGANSSKPGLVEQADGGTLLLDEIGEMGPEAQVKLLRFAQSGEFIPLGGTRTSRVDVRLIAASNRDLAEAIAERKFREDLYYRLNVVKLEIPPLCERAEDIPLLIDHFLRKHSAELGKEGYCFSADALDALQLYRWPGNVRELENVVKGALVMAPQSPIGQESLPVSFKQVAVGRVESTGSAKLNEIVSSHTSAVERRAIAEALRRCGGNQSKAARDLGIGRNTLLRKLKRYKIGS